MSAGMSAGRSASGGTNSARLPLVLNCVMALQFAVGGGHRQPADRCARALALHERVHTSGRPMDMSTCVSRKVLSRSSPGLRLGDGVQSTRSTRSRPAGRHQLRMAPSKLPRWTSPVGWMPETHVPWPEGYPLVGPSPGEFRPPTVRAWTPRSAAAATTRSSVRWPKLTRRRCSRRSCTSPATRH